jgi:CHAD domain-containing protein
MMAFDIPHRSFLLPRDEAASVFVQRMGDELAEAKNRLMTAGSAVPSTRTTTILDTADRRLRAAGLELRLDHRPDGDHTLLDDGFRSRPLQAELGRIERRLLVTDLPAGPVRDRLAPIVGVRALLPLVEVHRREIPLNVCNRDDKTVVRLTATDLSIVAPDGGEPLSLPGRVELRGVLGYPKPFAEVAASLADDLGLVDADEAVADAAVRALGQDPAGLHTRPRVDLDPEEPANRAAVRILTRLAAIAEANLAGTIDDLDPEFLHDLRVAVRRSRSVLRQMRRAFDPPARREQAETLRWVQAVTGPTRDLDVQLLEWAGLAVDLSPDRQADLAPAQALLLERRTRAFRAMKRTLRGPTYRQRWHGWRDFLERGLPRADAPHAPRPIREVAGRRIRSVYRRMVREGQAIDERSPAQALHDLRKRGKELRYLLEHFGGLWPTAVIKPLVTDLKGLQDVLGRHQDREVQAANLRSLAPDLATRPDGGAQAVLVLGSLVDRLETEQRRARDEFAGRFAVFASLPVPK